MGYNSTAGGIQVGSPSSYVLDCWGIQNQTTAGTSSVTKAAQVGVRHIARCVAITVAAGAAAQVPIIFNLRDGISGTGAILRTWSLSAPVNQSAYFSESDLNIGGTAGNAMTLEAVAPVAAAGVVVSVNLSGFDAN